MQMEPVGQANNPSAGTYPLHKITKPPENTPPAPVAPLENAAAYAGSADDVFTGLSSSKEALVHTDSNGESHADNKTERSRNVKNKSQTLEKNPALAAVVYEFVATYNVLTETLSAAQPSCEDLLSALRAAIYPSVKLYSLPQQLYAPAISLYEIGVSHSTAPDENRRLVIREQRLRTALETRSRDIMALFAQPDDGLLSRLCAILRPFADNPAFPPSDAVLRFTQHCDALSALLSISL